MTARFAMKLLARIREALGPAKETRQVVCDETGFTVVEHGKTLARVAWAEVLEIFAYKEDRFTTDDICLGFRAHEDGTFSMVSEDCIGYKDLLAQLERRFTGISTDWFGKVAFPAFAPNRTTLWGQTWRSSGSP
jgi:hypothetical protein